jgi:crossover junction endodeoxyribonuclease RusA
MNPIVLPWPPAVNNLFLNADGRGRIRTKRYDAWIAEATAHVWQQRPLKLKGRFHVTIQCDPPDRRRRDLDGLAKAPLDLLVKTGIIEDDSLALSLSLFWSHEPPEKPGCVRITLNPVEAPKAMAA